MANPLNISLKVTGLDQAKADLAAFATIGKRSFNEIANEAKNFAQSAATTDPALRGVANRVRQLAAASDEAFSSNLKLRQSLSDVERAYKAEIVSAESAARITATLRAEHDKLANSTRAISAEIKQLETISKVSYGGISAMAQRAARDIKPTAQSTHDLAVAMKELSLAADPAAAAQMRLLSGLTQVKSALDQKIISTQQAVRLEQYLREQSQATARAEAELENKTRSAAAARAQASIQAANAQKAASQIAIAAMQAEIRQMDALSQKSASDVIRGAPSGGRGPAAGTQGQVDLTTQMRDLSVKANPMGAANLELQNQMVAVNRARQQDIITKKQEAQIVQYLHNEHKKYVDSLVREETAHKKNVPAINASAQSVSKMNNAMTQLSFQINDIGTSLASGASPFMVLAQQGGQIYQVFQMAPGGAGGVLKAFGESILKLMTPVRLFIATVVAAGVATAALVGGAGRQTDELRKLSVALEGVGRSSLVTASGMAEVAKQLRNMGVARAEANKIVNDIARNPELNPAVAKQIVSTGADVGARLGVSTKEGIEAVTAALTDNADAVIKLGIATGALNKDQVQLLVTMSKTGKEFEARNLAFRNLAAGTAGAADRVKSEWEKAFIALGTAWDNFITKLQDTKFIKHLSEVMKGQIKEITDILDAISKWMESKGGPSVAPSGAPPATGGRVGPGGTGGSMIYGGTVSVAPVIGEGAKLTPAEVNLTIDMDPRAVELFELTKQVTGETGVRITPHGATGGTHVKGSQHYPWNTSSGRGVAFDYTFPGIGYNQVPDEATRKRYEVFNETAARLARERYGIEAGQGQKFPQYDPGHIDFRGLPALPGVSRIPEPLDRDLEGQRARARVVASGDAALPDAKKVADIAAALAAANTEARKSVEISQTAAGPGKAALEAYWGTYLPALAQGTQQLDAHNLAQVAAGKAFDLYNVQLKQGYAAEELATRGEREFAAALATSEEAAKKAAAAAAANEEVLAKGGDAKLIAERKYAAALAQTYTGLQRAQNDNKRRVEVLQLENQLSGQTSEVINYQVSLLQAKQKLQSEGVSLTSKEGEAYLKSAESLARNVAQHAEIARQQQKQDDMYRQIGSTIESAIGSVIDGIFDPKKAVDFGKAVKNMAQGLLKDLAMSQFVRPAIGNLLGGIGASANVVQGFGGSTAGIGGGSTTINLGGGGLFGGGGILSGLGKELGFDTGGSTGGMFSGVTDFFNKGLGGTFAYTTPGMSVSQMQGLGITGVTEPMAGVTVPGSVFGSTSFGSAVGGVGLGFMGGTMLNSLLGGNQKTGMIGSGVGGLAGMALGSMIGMPMIGGLLGGLLGGAGGGMFGNNKPSNASAGANIDLSQFRITSGFAGGNQQIDQQVAQMGQTLQGFLDLLKTTGGQLSGNVLLQSGVNTGITVDSSLEGYAGRFNLGKDTDAALKVMEQALVKSITGVSATMTSVLGQVGTDEDIAGAIQFAKAYDDIKTAADSAFETVEDGVNELGPFATAMKQINELFTSLTNQATRFGLALEPLNEALAEATERLQTDFTDAIAEATREAAGSSFVNELEALIENFSDSWTEAVKIGLSDQATGDALNILFMEQVGNVLEGLDDAQLTEVITYFQGFNQVITDMAVSAQISNDAVADLAATAEELAQRVAAASDQIQSYIDQITATAGTGVSPETAFFESQAQYQEQLAKAQSGDVEALESITEYADRFVQGIEGYFASSQAGVDLFNQMVSELSGLTTQTVGPHIDPAIETNTLLTMMNTTIETTGDAQVTALTDSTLALQQANADAAAAIIAQNLLDLETITGVTTKTAEDNILANTENTAALILQASEDSAALLLDNEERTAALVEANDLNAEALIDKNSENATALIDEAKLRTEEIIADNQLAVDSLIADAETQTGFLLEAYDKASQDALTKAQETSDALIEQAGGDTKLLLENMDTWGTDLHTEVHSVGGVIVEAITLWSPAIIQSVADGAASINLGLENWIGTQIGNDTDLANSAIESNTGLANSIVTAIGNAAATVVGGLDIWISKNMTNEKDLINSTINTDLTYTNAIIGGQVTAANSIIAADLTYTNSILAELDTNGTNTYNWLESINKWSKGIYDCCVFYGDKAIGQRQDMLNKLQSIDNNIRQFLNMPPVYGSV